MVTRQWRLGRLTLRRFPSWVSNPFGIADYVGQPGSFYRWTVSVGRWQLGWRR